MGKLQIIFNSEEPFLDRAEAGRLLGNELFGIRNQSPVVLGIPRGGVIVAAEIARLLNAELDVMLSRKLGAPHNAEVAIGALSEDGQLFLDQTIIKQVCADDKYVEKEKEYQSVMIQDRIARYRTLRPKIPLEGRVVIITDDGIATGATMEVSVWAIKEEDPEKLIVAVPIASPDAIQRIAEDADEVLALNVPPIFYAISQFYRYFEQTMDQEVLALLTENMKKIMKQS